MDDDDVADEIEHLLCGGLATNTGAAKTSQSAEDKVAMDVKEGHKSQKGVPTGLTVTMHEDSGEGSEADSKTEGNGNARHSNGAALMVPEDKDSEDFGTAEGVSPKPVQPSPQETEEDVSEGAEILPAVPTIASAARKALQQLEEQEQDQSPVVAARKLPDGAMTCNLKAHRYATTCCMRKWQ